MQIWPRARWPMSHWFIGCAAYCGKNDATCRMALHPVWVKARTHRMRCVATNHNMPQDAARQRDASGVNEPLGCYRSEHCGWLSICPCRRYATTMKRPYEVRYDPLTQSVNLLTSKEALTSISDNVRYQLSTLHGALSRIDHLSIPSP